MALQADPMQVAQNSRHHQGASDRSRGDARLPRIKRLLFVFVAVVLVTAACSENAADNVADNVDRADPFGPIDGPIADVVDREIKANSVVDLPCIPSRRDPIGMWVAMRVDSARSGTNSFTIGLEETDVRFGSHPSGCNSPELLLAQSVFLLAANDPIFVARQSVVDGVTLLEFDIDEGAIERHSLVVVPTFRYNKADGTYETGVFGRVGRYSLVGS